MWRDPKTNVYLEQKEAVAVCEQRLVAEKCKQGKHNFKEFEKRSKESVYYCRVCSACGAEEIKTSGPLGDNKWRNVEDEWKWAWEKEDFDTAISSDT